MITVDDIARFLDAFAPLRLAESWDNVGLLVGDRHQAVQRIMTCLTITPSTAREAIAEHADLVVVHHPLPFTALKRLTTDSSPGRLLWSLAGGGISVYSAHTAFDSAPAGINEQLAAGIGLSGVEPLTTRYEDPDGRRLGAGRQGFLLAPTPLATVAQRVKQFLQVPQVQVVGNLDAHVTKIAVACGSAGDLLADAQRAECECFVTGEVRFHTALEAESMGIALVLAGHYTSERFAVVGLADVLAREFPTVKVWSSAKERDPLVWV